MIAEYYARALCGDNTNVHPTELQNLILHLSHFSRESVSPSPSLNPGVGGPEARASAVWCAAAAGVHIQRTVGVHGRRGEGVTNCYN